MTVVDPSTRARSSPTHPREWHPHLLPRATVEEKSHDQTDAFTNPTSAVDPQRVDEGMRALPRSAGGRAVSTAPAMASRPSASTWATCPEMTRVILPACLDGEPAGVAPRGTQTRHAAEHEDAGAPRDHGPASSAGAVRARQASAPTCGRRRSRSDQRALCGVMADREGADPDNVRGDMETRGVSQWPSDRARDFFDQPQGPRGVFGRARWYSTFAISGGGER